MKIARYIIWVLCFSLVASLFGCTDAQETSDAESISSESSQSDEITDDGVLDSVVDTEIILSSNSELFDSEVLSETVVNSVTEESSVAEDIQYIIDYGDEESFEAALNAGENLEGKIVQFVARNIHPQSAVGYNVTCGEHLNFASSRNPNINIGDTVTVRATTIESMLGSWIIHYEKVENAIIGDETIFQQN